jgi:hypothetical protein
VSQARITRAEEVERLRKEEAKPATLRIRGTITPEVWNKLGVRILPRLRAGKNLRLGLDFECQLSAEEARAVAAEIRQAVTDLGLAGQLQVGFERTD